jgi:cytochrome c553
MKDYAKEDRANDIYSRMRIIAKGLTREEINELAVYYARLGNEQSDGSLQQAAAD